jgi:hypothetical protein
LPALSSLRHSDDIDVDALIGNQGKKSDSGEYYMVTCFVAFIFL